MGVKGRKIAEAHDWKHIVKKTEELYNEALDPSLGLGTHQKLALESLMKLLVLLQNPWMRAQELLT